MIDLHHISALSSEREQSLIASWRNVLARSEAGFTRICEGDHDWQALKDRAKLVSLPEQVLVVGIGGSSLGTQVIYEAFRHKSVCNITFLESPDPHTWNGLLARSAWHKTHLVIVSKSGNTLETLALTEKLAAQVPELFQAERVTVITSPGEGPLQKWAQQRGFSILWIPNDVGGRFSVLTAVGMFPAALMGLEPERFRRGAQWALTQIDKVSMLSAAILDSWQRQCWTTQMWTYAERLKVFGEWWTQLWSESLGKKLSRNGEIAARTSVPLACLGPRDQHSLVQQLIEGPKDKYVFVLRVREVENADENFVPKLFPQMPFAGQTISLGKILASEAEAFQRSLDDVGILQGGVLLDKVDEDTLGALFMLWQMVIAQVGEVLHINAFDQPGVELGKRYAQEILKGKASSFV